VAHELGITDKSKGDSRISKIAIGIRSLADRMSVKAANNYVEHDLVQVLIECTDIASTQKKIESLGGSSTRLTSNKVAAGVPRSKLKSLAGFAKIGYVEASTQLKPTCDLAHESSGLTANGSVTVLQKGSGVLIGIIDTGIDVGHAAFQSNGSTRIVNYLDQETGNEFSQTQIDAGDADGAVDLIGHGTHVAGIAAGNGAGSPNKRWRGVAPEADLAIVKTTFDSADIAVAISHIFNLADARNQPCVVNLSLGGHFGAHDGSSVSERMIDDLSGDGRVVVVSAGNEGNSSIHASTVLDRAQAPADRWVADFRISPRIFQTASGPQQAGLIRVQVWHPSEDAVTILLRSPTGNTFQAPQNDKQESNLGNIFVEASHQQHPYSLDHSTSFLIVTDPDASLLSGWSIIAEDNQAAGGVKVGSVHCWILDSAMGNFTSGMSNSHLVGMPGTSFSAVTVASYASRKEWPSRAPNVPGGKFRADAINLGDISHFSSMGPSRDGHNKPEIAGPGQLLLAPLSSHTSLEHIPDFLRVSNRPYAGMQGTSMSSPYVAGAIALLLEKNNNLNWAEIKRRLIKSALQDEFTQPCWNARWGYGRLQVQRLLEIEPAS
jgi:subtilisin family serine protease